MSMRVSAAPMYYKDPQTGQYVPVVGIQGATGKGIKSIRKTGTDGQTDTYTITYDDDSTSTYTLVNEANGEAYGAGKRNGVPVTSGDPAYQNNAPYYADLSRGYTDGKHLDGSNNAALSENNAKYYSQLTEAATVHQPIIGQNKNWWIWNQQSGAYVDSGKPAAWPDSDPELTNALTDVVDDWLTDHPEATTTVDFSIATKVFPTVADMVADLTLESGDNVATRGYYSDKDNGGNNYVISENHTGAFYLEIENGLYANLLTETGTLRAESIGIKAYSAPTENPDAEDMAANKTLFEKAVYNGVYLLFGKGVYYFSDSISLTARKGVYHIKGLDRSVSRLYFPNSDGLVFDQTQYYNYWWFDNFSINSYGDCIKCEENIANLVDCGFEHLGLTSETGSCFVSPSYNVSKFISQGGSTVYDTAVQNCAFNYINGQANNGSVFKNIMGMGNQYRHINIIGSTLYGFWNCDGRVEDVNTLGTGIQFMFYYDQAYSHSLILYLIRVNAEGVRGGFIYSENEVPLQSGEDPKKPTTAHQLTLTYLYAWQSGMSLHGDITENHDIYPVTINVLKSAFLIHSSSIFKPSAYPSKYDTSKVKANMWSRRNSALSLNESYVGSDITYIVGASGGSGTGIIYSVESIYKRRIIDRGLQPGYAPNGTEMVPGFNKLSTKFLIGGKNTQVYNQTLTGQDIYLNYTGDFDARGADVLVYKNEVSAEKRITGINTQANCPGKIYTIENSSSSTGNISLAHKYNSNSFYFFFDDLQSKLLEPGQSIQIVLAKIKINNTYYNMWTEVSGNRSKIVAVEGSTPVISGVKGTRYMCGEVSNITITPPSNGVIEVYFTSGSTAAELALPRSVYVPDGFNPKSLEANTRYKITITDGTYGEVDTFVTQPFINLLDPTTFVDGKVWWKGSATSGYNNNCITPKVEITPGKKYILQRDPGGQGYVSWFDENEAYISQEQWGTGTTKTIADGVHYVGISIAISGKDTALLAEY